MLLRLFVASTLTLASALALADEVPSEMVRDAIAHGKKKGQKLEAFYRLCPGPCLWGTAYVWATLTTPFLVVARAAAADPNFAERDVTPEMLVPEVRVQVFATSGWSVKRVVIVPAQGPPIEPIRSERVASMRGFPQPSFDLVAFFPLSLMQATNELQAFMEGGPHKPHVYKQKLNPRKMR